MGHVVNAPACFSEASHYMTYVSKLSRQVSAICHTCQTPNALHARIRYDSFHQQREHQIYMQYFTPHSTGQSSSSPKVLMPQLISNEELKLTAC